MSDAEALRDLMEADRWLDRVTSQRGHLPEMHELTLLEEELRFLMQALHEAQSTLGPVRADFENAKNEAERLAGRARELEATLATSTANARELTTMQRELEHLRDVLDRAEDRELEILEVLEPLEAAQQAIKERAQPGIARRTSLQDTIRALQASLDDELVSLRASREERAAQLSRDLLAQYEQSKCRAGTSGAAQVVKGRCDGCRIALSPLDVDRWKAQPESIFMPCPECGRLLVP